MNFTRFTRTYVIGHLANVVKAVPFKALLKPQLESEFSFSHARRQPNSSFFLEQD